MGKKSKQGKNKIQAPGGEKVKNPDKVGAVEATNGVVSLSKKSKKIKKEKKHLLKAAKLSEAVKHTPDASETDKVDKIKKKKNKLKQNGNKPNVKTEPQETDHESEPVRTQVSKKQSNKKKHKEIKKPKMVAADNDVVTSESESEAEKEDDVFKEMDATNQSILSHPDVNDSSDDERDTKKGAQKKTPEEKKEKRFPGREHAIFIGNLPKEAKHGMMKTLFKPYGQVLTIRFRTFDGVPLLNKKDRKEAKSLNCYIRFETKQEAEAACAMNGQMVAGNRIRVMMQTRKQVGHHTSTVFIGNISRKTTDNDLYDFFSRVGEIEYVRQIADRGIGYVCFKKGVSIAKALKMNQELLNGRPLRIQKVDPTKSTRRNKKGNLVKKNRLPGGVAKQPNSADQNGNVQKEKKTPEEFHGTVTKNKRDKKKNKGSSDKKKKVLAQKLMAAGAPKNK